MFKTLKEIIKRGWLTMFNANSGLVKIWFGAVLNPDSQYLFKDVPKLSNLREEVEKQLIAYGYDTTNEAPKQV